MPARFCVPDQWPVESTLIAVHLCSMKTPLTTRQQAILSFIEERIGQGLPPTRGDIAEAFGFSSRSAAEQHLRALAGKGVIVIDGGRSRGIRLVGASDAGPDQPARSMRRTPGLGLGLPLIGRVAAGKPLLAEEHVESVLAVDPGCFRPHADYLLRVFGDSMIDDGILPGDCVAVHRQADADSGALVVARIDDEVTVKRLERREGHIRLLPANAAYAPIVPLPDQVFVLEGLVVGVLRVGVDHVGVLRHPDRMP